MRLFNYIINLFKPYEVPENHEQCPTCKGMGSTDGLLNCDYCDGHGHVSNWKAIEYEKRNP